MEARMLGNGKQTKHKARVVGDYLHCAEGRIGLGSESWFAWLEQNNAFYVEVIDAAIGRATFTARKERRSGTDHWYAYTRTMGKLHKRYIGQTDQVTWGKLVEMTRTMPTGKVMKKGGWA